MPVSRADYTANTRIEKVQPSRKRRRTEDQSTAHISDSEEQRPTTSYIGGLDASDRLDMTLQYLRDTHGWSMKDLLHYYMTAESKKPYATSKKTRLNRLTEALNQKEHLDLLFSSFQCLI
jgi:hypothetical protein